ncbi:hypothetical protein KFE25_012205 [Diacronema lutheri]|uniref:Uncharacterized protein n=1 Tax=Diacronema lutheri TaxID=2081491 RepID=A0A8J5XNE5_DIALT|nr:hypothetical protein KFE25_012205 [Diacronema lutheri]
MAATEGSGARSADKGQQCASAWNGRYIDPKHPRGWREVSLDGDMLTIKGRDEPGADEWRLQGAARGTSITLDFSPKGGPKDLHATLADDSGSIRFADGNSWSKLSPWDGRYADPNHTMGWRDVKARGDKLIIAGRDDDTADTWEINGQIQGGSVELDFSPKGGPKGMKATLASDCGSIQFSDGNTWTKAY